MENGIEKSPDRSSSPSPFLGFSPQKEVKKEVSKVAESPSVRVSQPRTTKSRASLVWQKNCPKTVTIKEEPEDEEYLPKKPVMSFKLSASVTKQKQVKTSKATEKEFIKTLKVEKDGKEKDVNSIEENLSGKDSSEPDDSNVESVPSTSTGNRQDQHLGLLLKKRNKVKKTNKHGFKCTQCGRVYKYLRGMRQHQKLECNVEPQFPCPYCPNKFRYRQGIREHVRIYHEQAFPKWYATHYVIPMLKQEKLSP